MAGNRRSLNNIQGLNGIVPLAYLGVNPSTPPQSVAYPRDPTTKDARGYMLLTLWLNTVTQDAWLLVKIYAGIYTWVKFSTGSTGDLQKLTGNSGTANPVANNINIVTANSTVLFIGAGDTLTQDFIGQPNLAFGSTLPAITSGVNNVTLGRFNGRDLTSGNGNTLIGHQSGFTMTTSVENTAVGSQTLALYLASAGGPGITVGANTAIGAFALDQLTSGKYNTCVGDDAGENYTGAESSNILIGSGVSGTGGESNTLRIGTATGAGDEQINRAFVSGIYGITSANPTRLAVIIDADGQLGTGGASGGIVSSVTAGENINLTGTAQNPVVNLNEIIRWPNTNGAGTMGAIYLGATCGGGSCTGGTLFMHNYGTSNTFLGASAGNLTMVGVGLNVGIGFGVLNAQISGISNTAVGALSQSAITVGQDNSTCGYASLLNLTAGSYNCALGSGAGSALTLINGSNICIGYNTTGTAGDNNTLTIGAGAGTAAGQLNRAFIHGIYGITPAGGTTANVIVDSNGQLGSASIGAGSKMILTGTAGASVLFTASTTLILSPFLPSSSATAGALVSMYVPYAGVASNLQVNTFTNTLDLNGTVTLYKNGSPTSCTVTVTAGATGPVYDNVNTATFAANDVLTWETTLGAATGAHQGQIVMVYTQS